MGKVRRERSLGTGFDPGVRLSPEDVAHPKDSIEAPKEMKGENLQKYSL
jgi:hypothetical protein